MPDVEGNPTVQDMAKELGWTDDDIDVDEPETVAAPAPVTSPQPSAPAAVAPAPVVAPALPVSPAPVPAPNYEQLYQRQQGGLQRQATEEQAKSNINVEAGQYKNRLIASGYEETAAHEAATQFATGKWATHQLDQSNQRELGMARHQAAQLLATQYGVPAEQLMGYPDATSMEAAALAGQQQNTRFANLEAQVKTAVAVPVQTFDSGQGGGGGSDAQKRMDYATGKASLDTAEYNRLFPN